MKKTIPVKYKRLIIIGAALLAVAAIVICFFIIRNGGRASYKVLFECDFSDGAGSFSKEGYFADVSRFDVVPEGPDGSNCARIISDGANDARFRVVIPTVQNTYYKVTAKVRTKGVESPGKAAGANISALYSYDYKGGLVGDNDWTELTVYGLTSAGQTEAGICFRLGFYSCDTTGTVWFDDIRIEQLSSLPQGASAISFEQTMLNTNSGASSGATTANQRDLVNQYYDGIKVGLIIIGVAFLFFAVMYRYGVMRDKERSLGIDHTVEVLVPLDRTPGPEEFDETITRSSPLTADEASEAVKETKETEERPYFKTVKVGYKGLNTGLAVLIMLLVGLVLRLVISVTGIQCGIDVALFQSWGKHIVSDGIPNFYANASAYSLDYPPLYMYFLWFNTLLTKWFGLMGTAGHTLLTKLPSVLADIGIGWVLYKMAGKKLNKSWTLFIVALWVMNPLSVLDSAAWGQVDSILALLCLLMMWFIIKDKYIPASVMLGLAIILKPQGIFMVPVIGFALLRRLFRNKDVPKVKTVLLIFKCILAALGTILAVAFPFGVKMQPNFISWIINLYIGTANGYKGATVNSYNFYYVIQQNWTPDSNTFLFGMSYFTFGMIMIVVSCLITFGLYMFTKREDEAMPFLLASSMIYMVTMFGPRMHERYFFPCALLLLAAVLYSNNKILLWIYGALTGVNFMSVLSVMLGLEIGGGLKNAGADQDLYGKFYWAAQEPHRQITAWLNLACCITLLVIAVLCAVNVIKAGEPRFRIWNRSGTLSDDTEDSAHEE